MALKDPKLPLQRFWQLLSTERKDVGKIYVYALFNGLLTLSIPLGIQAIINLIQSGTSSTAWVVLVIVVLLGLALAGIFQIFQLSVAERIQQRLFVNASIEFAYRIPRIKLSALKNYYPPELVNRFFDVLTVQKGLYKLLFDFSVASLQIVFGLILLSLYHPFFIAFGFFLIFVLMIFFRLTSRRGLETSIQESNSKYEVVSWLEELGRNLSTFKMAGRTDLPMEQADKLSTNYLRSRRAHFSVLLRQYGSLVFFKVLIAGGLLLLGGLLVFDAQMNIGQFVAAEIVIVQIISSVEKLVYSIETIYDVLTGLEKLGAVTDLELENQDESDQLRLENGDKLKVKVKNLNLNSPQWGHRILSDINFEINHGEKIGIAGGMSSGKSSLLQLIAGLFDSYEGSLLYNDIPYNKVQLESLRSLIGDNLRQEEIFEASILDNISLRRKSVSPENVMELLELVGLKDFVEDLPNGIYTALPTGGLGLASSTRNRLLMARSLAGTHSLLLLEDNWFDVDDATRNRWLDHLCFDCGQSVVMATNNLESLKRMNRIILLEKGKIVKIGSFDELKNDLPC
ncbi:MAG: ATP-binding cassette domain-containing protein [Bacteroidetes bacterium]|nr:ATP-binding cassette domain-containing protein [Bacteroidota bacterium]